MPRAKARGVTLLRFAPRTSGRRPMTTPARMIPQKRIWLVVSLSEYQTQATTAATGAATVSSIRGMRAAHRVAAERQVTTGHRYRSRSRPR